jgi:hypothetical protein
VLKSPVAIRALAPSEAETSRPVKLTATVVSKMRDEDVYFVHDGAGGLLVHVVGNQAGLVVSKQVEIVGHTVSEADVHVVVDEIRLVEQRVPLPAAIALSQPELLDPDNVHRWIELRGTVRSFTDARAGVYPAEYPRWWDLCFDGSPAAIGSDGLPARNAAAAGDFDASPVA